MEVIKPQHVGPVSLALSRVIGVFGIPSREITEQHEMKVNIFKATNTEENKKWMQLIKKNFLASKTTSHNFTVADQC